MPFLSELHQIAVKAETTEGTDAVVAATNVILTTQDASVDYDAEAFETDRRRDSFSPMPGLAGPSSVAIGFSFDLWGNAVTGAAGTAPSWGPALIACGFTETIVATTSVTYKPSAAPAASATVARYLNNGSAALRQQALGARGNLELSAQVGQALVAKCSFQGAYQAPTDTTMLVPTYDDDAYVPPRFQGLAWAFTTAAAGTTLASTEAVLQSWNLNMNAVLTPRTDANHSNGIASYALTGRKPTGSFEAELTTVAACNMAANIQAGTTGSISFILGTGVGKVITVTLGACQIKKINRVNAGGIERMRCDYAAYASAVGLSDEISIAIT